MIQGNIELFNIDCVLNQDGQRVLCRVPESVREHLNPAAHDTASVSATGSEIRFVMREGCDRVVLHIDSELDFMMMQLYYGQFQGGWTYLQSKALRPGHNDVVIERPKEMDRLRERAKEYGHVFSPDVMRLRFRSGKLSNVSVEGDVRPPRPEEVPAKSILFYGSSITHGSLSVLPCGDYSSLVADALGMDHFNKGMAGSCHMEREMADYIAARDDYEFCVFELGSNLNVGPEGISEEEFTARAEYLLTRCAQAHPDKLIFVIDDLIIDRDGHLTQVRLTKALLERLNNPNFVYCPGRDMLPSGKYLSADFTHPTVEGHQVMAQYLLRRMAEKGLKIL